MRRLSPLLAVAVAGLWLTAPARASGPTLVVGAVEDAVRQPTLEGAKAKFSLLSLAGLRAVRVSSIWAPGESEPAPGELDQIRIVAGAAQLAGMRTYVSVYNAGNRTTPLSDEDQAAFASYAAAIVRAVPAVRYLIVGNEPNINRFWLPQFGPDGTDAAAPAYLSLLARTYDAVKAVSPAATVVGGAVSPRGSDKPDGIRPTHSPTAFITDLGAAYRASGRAQPVMDQFAIHPYQDNSSMPPDVGHPNTTSIGIADYGKLVALLGAAFDGTAQRGSTLPIVYGEFGVETTIPSGKASLYTGVEPATIKPVDPETQGAFYRQALGLTFCQPTVTAFLILHTIDESDLNRWQSGVYYVDSTPKSSLPIVTAAVRDVRGGVIARCDGLKLRPKATIAYPRGSALTRVPLRVRLTCSIDCLYRVRVERYPRGSTTLSVRGRGKAGIALTALLPPRRLAKAVYRFTVSLTAPVNPGPTATIRGPVFRIR